MHTPFVGTWFLGAVCVDGSFWGTSTMVNQKKPCGIHESKLIAERQMGKAGSVQALTISKAGGFHHLTLRPGAGFVVEQNCVGNRVFETVEGGTEPFTTLGSI